MSDPHASVTLWLEHLKQGDLAAARPLWERFFNQLVALARQALRAAAAGQRTKRTSPWKPSTFSAAVRPEVVFPPGRPPRPVGLAGGAHRPRQRPAGLGTCSEAGGGQVRGGSVLGGADSTEAAANAFDRLAGPEPTPEFAAQVTEECRRLLEVLGDPNLRQIALWKLEGYNNREIARRQGCVTTTVERRLRLIRSLWEKEVNCD